MNSTTILTNLHFTGDNDGINGNYPSLGGVGRESAAARPHEDTQIGSGGRGPERAAARAAAVGMEQQPDPLQQGGHDRAARVFETTMYVSNTPETTNDVGAAELNTLELVEEVGGENLPCQGDITSEEDEVVDPGDFDIERPGGHHEPHGIPERIEATHRARPQNASKKNTKAAVRLATLNIRGYRSAGEPRSESKWNHINQLIRDKKIGLLLVQESHLTEERVADIECLFGKRLSVFHSPDPVNPTGRGGVAVVLNKDLVNTREAEMKEIIPGRAMLVTAKWHREETLNILNVYAPNVTESDGAENANFWRDIKQYFVSHPRTRVDVLAGDFNMTEDAYDRIPMRSDPGEAIEALDALKRVLRTNDTWRETFPDKRMFTFFQDTTNSMSRLDRIYTAESISQAAREWDTSPSGIPGTDHFLAMVQLAHADSPSVGRGRWVLRRYVLRDKHFRSEVIKQGAKAIEDMEKSMELGSPGSNPQSIYRKWKEDILALARGREKVLVPMFIKTKRGIEKKLGDILADEDMGEATKVREAHRAARALDELEKNAHMEKRDRVKIKNRIDGETMCKYWTRSGKQAPPRDLIYALKKENPTPQSSPYEKDSARMAELARNYHDNLQQLSRLAQTEVREEKISKALGAITTHTTVAQEEILGSQIELDEIKAALKCSKNSSAPGVDGLTYDFWKSFNGQFINDSLQNARGGPQKTTCNVLEMLRLVYNDIQNHGIRGNASFAEGWMCPLYKKNEKTEIANYRPITCLNTDYKLLTKALATRLAKVITDLIHPSQAGFIPGRSIAEQTKLIRMMMYYAEAREDNGVIVALDQEKAYDKIDHGYLWRTLEAFGIPAAFIDTVRALYTNAETKIMINGVMSSPWKITRGVRQGDPLSCLLFDLAIEPLAAMLRNSDLKGFGIPGMQEKLIANLFADDTTVFLSEEDDFGVLNGILEDWCIASTAKFNITKTEVLPIGAKAFRLEVLRDRTMRPGSGRIPDDIHIVEEGSLIRILGAWFGNEADLSAPWTSTLAKIDRCLASWEKSHPTMEGRRLIAQMVVAGMSQYLAQVQNMPPLIEKLIVKRTMSFMWAGKSPLVNADTMARPVGEGGRALIDIRTRNKAIDVMWLKSYLSWGPQRPSWALVADAIMAKNVPRTEERVDDRVKVSPFLQSWKTRSAPSKDTCPDILNLLNTAKSCNVRPEGIAFSRKVQRGLPIWYHFAADRKIRRMNGGRVAECLKTKHGVMTVGDAEKLSACLVSMAHRDSDECECEECMALENGVNCLHPHSCVEKARAMVNTLPSKWNPLSPQPYGDNGDANRPCRDGRGEEVRVFNRDSGTVTCLEDIFRAFTTGPRYDDVFVPGRRNEAQPLVAFGAGAREGTKTLGAGVAFEDRDDLNHGGKLLPLGEGGGNDSSILAIMLASIRGGINTDLTIGVRSKETISALTEDLARREDEGFLTSKDTGLIRILLGRLRMHSASVTLKDLSKSPVMGTEHAAGALARQALDNPRPVVPPPIPTELHLTGAKLSKMTQARAYKWLREETPRNVRLRTKSMVLSIQRAVEAVNGYAPSERQVWGSLRSKDLSRQTRVFLWKSAHDAYKVGSYWNRPSMRPELKVRHTCEHDGKEESMNHIVSECECPGQALVWTLAGELWKEKTGVDLPSQNISTVLGSVLMRQRNSEGKQSAELSRLFRIIVIESAYLIWVLRCERVIRNEGTKHSNEEIRNRWAKTLLNRAEMDMKLTDRKLGKKSIPRAVVEGTWNGTRFGEIILSVDPNNGETGGVLVGIWPSSRAGVG